MGKIRVKSFGDQEQEEKDKRLSAKRAEKKEQKNAAKKTEDAVIEGQAETLETKVEETVTKPSSAKASEGRRKNKFSKQKETVRSQNYLAKAALINPEELYAVSEALKLLGQVHMAKFDETVELHINTTASGISGQITLPHGSGKQIRVAIADDAVIAEVEKGKINFDILIAHPTYMPKLAKVAKVLGPRGLMPNPKNGTISLEPEKVAKKFEGGAMNFKTEAKAPIIHLIVGKLSFGTEKLSENISEAIKAIKKANIVNVTLKSSMSPGIKLKV